MEKKTQNQIITAISIFFFLVIVVILSIYNSFVTVENAMNATWLRVEDLAVSRGVLIQDLVSLISQYDQKNLKFAKELSDTQAGFSKAQSVLDKMENLKKIDEKYTFLLVRLKQEPVFRDNSNFLYLAAEINSTKKNMEIEMELYNEHIKYFNAKVHKPYSGFIAQKLGFREIK